MPSIGAGVNEIRIHAGNAYRVIYVAKFAEAVYVLHAFAKKTPRPLLTILNLRHAAIGRC
jgi:phage-related protein